MNASGNGGVLLLSGQHNMNVEYLPVEISWNPKDLSTRLQLTNRKSIRHFPKRKHNAVLPVLEAIQRIGTIFYKLPAA